jgi:hypothetical protein
MRSKRLSSRSLVVLSFVCAVALLVPAAALAHHLASGSTKRAVLQSLARIKGSDFHSVNGSHNCHTLAVPCWQVEISGNSWAASYDFGPGNDGAGEFAYISHLVDGRWTFLGGWGEGTGFQCKRYGMSHTISRDLKVYCS